MKSLKAKDMIEARIFIIRGHRVILDKVLASLYEVKPIALRQQVKRNKKRFPGDFIFKLTQEEADLLVSQNVIPSKRSLGGYLPYVFTEQGVAMLSSVLKSEKAIQMNIAIMRVFVKLRAIASSHKELIHKLDQLEDRLGKHDQQIGLIFEAIRQLMEPAEKPKRKIGFHNS